MPQNQRTTLPLWTGFLLALPLAAWSAVSTASCTAQSGPRVPWVVELYTSEGCSSCPPADRWLSTLKPQPELVALAFHVDYWDRLGWKDRFSSAAYSQRQSQLMRTSGARYAYTPQVVVDGRDQPRWPALTWTAPRTLSAVQITLKRDGETYVAELRPLPGAPPRIAGFWALTEDGHASAVKSGENRGVTLAHDFVVREYEPIARWDARDAAPRRLQFNPSQLASAAYPRRTNLVLVDADSGRVLQALALGC